MSSSNPFNAFGDPGCRKTPSCRISTHCSTHITTDDQESPALECSAASASGVSSHVHYGFQDWTSTLNLSCTGGAELDCTVSSTADTSRCESSSNVDEGFQTFQYGSCSIQPTATQPLLSVASSRNLKSSCRASQIVELDNIPSTFNFQGFSMLGNSMPMDHRTSDGANSCRMVQDNLQRAFTEYVPRELAGIRNPEIDAQQQSETGFSSAPVHQYPIEPLSNRNQIFFEEIGWPPQSPLPCSLNGGSLGDKTSSSKDYDIISPHLQTHQTSATIIGNLPQPGNPIARRRDIDEIESEPKSLLRSKISKRTFSYREIAPKGNITSRDIIGHRKKSNGTKGKRKKPLGPEKSKKITNMREIRACASCFISHAECSEDFVCLRCRRTAERAAIEPLSCLRGPLQSWKELFFPDLVSGHITQWSLDNWIKKRGMTFTDDCISVTLSADPFGFTIPLVVHEVSVSSQEYLVVSDLTAQPSNESGSFATQHTLPYGYRGDTDQLQRRCSQYINSISKHSLFNIDNVIGDTSDIVWKALKAVSDYNQANPVSKKEGILWKGIKVFWMDYLMDRCFAFTHDSAMKALQSFHDPSTVFPETSFMSAALLSRQIKLAINLDLDTCIGDLLEELEQHSRKTRASWFTCFCINIILCILVEHVQIATDAIVVELVSEGKDSADTRKNGIQICQALEELPMKYSWTLFHGIQRKYNPLKSGCPVGNDQNNGEQGLIDAVRQLMLDHVDEITEKTLEPCLGGCSENAIDHARFRAHNSGRHVSRFLRNFG